MIIRIFLSISLLLTISTTLFSQMLSKNNLKSAYCKNAEQELKYMFAEWEESGMSVSVDSLNLMGNGEKQSYMVFKEFYNPTNLQSYGGVQLDHSIYKNAKYIVPQSKLEYFIIKNRELKIDIKEIPDSLFKKRSVIEDFRPILKTTKSILYKEDVYRNILSSFLNDSLNCSQEKLSAKDLYFEKIKRIKFLENFLKILPTHWGDDFYVVTHPHVESIVFNSNLSKAIIKFRVGWEGGEALFYKMNKNWEMVSSEILWNE